MPCQPIKVRTSQMSTRHFEPRGELGERTGDRGDATAEEGRGGDSDTSSIVDDTRSSCASIRA